MSGRANPKGDNNHRVVIYRDAADKALQILPLPTMLVGPEGSDPERLWASLQAYEDKTGGQVMAIPHNGNWSSGQMFQETKFQSNETIRRVLYRKSLPLGAALRNNPDQGRRRSPSFPVARR